MSRHRAASCRCKAPKGVLAPESNAQFRNELPFAMDYPTVYEHLWPKMRGIYTPFFPVVLDLVIFLKSWMRQNRLVCDSRFKLCSDEVGDSATSWGWNPAISLCLKPTLPRLVLFCGARKRYLYLCSVELFFLFLLVCWLGCFRFLLKKSLLAFVKFGFPEQLLRQPLEAVSGANTATDSTLRDPGRCRSRRWSPKFQG